MMNERELGHVLIATIILVFVISFKEILAFGVNYTNLGIIFMFVLLVLLVNILSKKAMAYQYEATLETKIWQGKRFGFKRERELKNLVPVGIFAPVLITLVTLGNFFLFTVLESSVEGTSARASKRHGRFRFTEMTDSNISMIMSMGVIANLILAVIAYLINLGTLAEISIYYAFYSLIPFGNLDGTKIFFGTRNFWFALMIIALIFVSFALFIPR
jgi:hypothetical protein